MFGARDVWLCERACTCVVLLVLWRSRAGAEVSQRVAPSTAAARDEVPEGVCVCSFAFGLCKQL